jgi:hypothetical protein
LDASAREFSYTGKFMAKVVGVDIADVLTSERLAEVQESNEGIADEERGSYEWRKEEQCQESKQRIWVFARVAI